MANIQDEGDAFEALVDLVDKEQERVRYYRNEWENATDRANGMADLYYEAKKDRDELHRIHCLDLDAILALTTRAEVAEAKLDNYRQALEFYANLNGPYQGDVARAVLKGTK